jgi:predicted heme/steroid binding protein
MKIKKTSLFSAVLAFLLVSVLTVGVFAVTTDNSPEIEYLYESDNWAYVKINGTIYDVHLPTEGYNGGFIGFCFYDGSEEFNTTFDSVYEMLDWYRDYYNTQAALGKMTRREADEKYMAEEYVMLSYTKG